MACKHFSPLNRSSWLVYSIQKHRKRKKPMLSAQVTPVYLIKRSIYEKCIIDDTLKFLFVQVPSLTYLSYFFVSKKKRVFLENLFRTQIWTLYVKAFRENLPILHLGLFFRRQRIIYEARSFQKKLRYALLIMHNICLFNM